MKIRYVGSLMLSKFKRFFLIYFNFCKILVIIYHVFFDLTFTWGDQPNKRFYYKVQTVLIRFSISFLKNFQGSLMVKKLVLIFVTVLSKNYNYHIKILKVYNSMIMRFKDSGEAADCASDGFLS